MDCSILLETKSDRRKRYANEIHNYSDCGVLLGYWFDERARKEIETEELLEAASKNQLPSQKLDTYVNLLSRPIKLTRNLDGFLHHADIVQFKCTCRGHSLFLSALPHDITSDGTFAEPCSATASTGLRIMARNAFHVFRNNNFVPNHVPLVYGEMVFVCTVEDTGHRVLHCQPKSFARKSNHVEVIFVKELSGMCLWRIHCPVRKNRLISEGHYVPVNTNIVLSHVATGQNLALETDTVVESAVGEEKEVSVHTYLNRNKLEEDENIWRIEAPRFTLEEYGQPVHLPREIV